jgi:hypothetical protein
VKTSLIEQDHTPFATAILADLGRLALRAE